MNGRQSSIFINKEYNPLIAATVLKRNWWWTVLFVCFFTGLAFIYLRYTKPVYDSSMLIQLADTDQGKEVLEIENINTKDNIASQVELLRSELLFGMAIERLNINVSLFAKGRILTEEKYLQSTFNIQPFQLLDSALCDVPIGVELVGKKKVRLSYQLNGKDYSFLAPINKRFSNQHFEIIVKVDNLRHLQIDDDENELYFTFNKLKTLVQRLMPNLEVTPADPEAKTVQIRYQGNNQQLCHDITDALARSYFRYDEEMKRKSAENIIAFINKQLDSISGELRLSKDSLTLFQSKVHLNDPEQVGQNLSDNMNQFQDQLFVIEEEMSTLSLVLSKLRKEPNRLEIYRLIPEMMGKSYEVSLTKQITDLHTLLERKEDLQFDITDDHTEIKSLNQRIQSKIQSIRRSVEAIEERLANNAKILNGKINLFEREYDSLPSKEIEYNRLKSLQELNEKYFGILSDKLAIYSISDAGYSSNNIVLREATLSGIPVSPNNKIVYAGFIFLGIILGFGMLLYRYITFNEINSLEDLKQLLPEKVNMLGSIPLLKDTHEYSELLVHESPKSLLAEALRNVRTNLSFIKSDARVIAITSSISGEGKTFLALNLAGIIALSGKKTIVLDLDLRKPKVHLGLNAPNNNGISNLIIKKITLENCILRSAIENLDFITAGPIPPNPSELILSDSFQEILEELKKMYDVIVIDNPPVGLVTDGVKILANADVPIYVFKSHYSKRIFANRVRELFEMKQIKQLNIILNGTSSKGRSYGYGYGYGYGYYEEEQQSKRGKKRK